MRAKISKNKNLILLGIIILGIIIRVYSLSYGLPHIFAPDEKRQVLDALSMGGRRSFLPLEYTYPALHKYFLLFCFGIYFCLGYVFRIFSNLPDFIFKFLINPGEIFFIARLTSVIFGLALAVPVYLLGKKISSKNSGLIASLFAMFMFQLVAHSQWGTADIMLGFLSTWAFYYIVRCFSYGTRRDYIFTGMFIGLAVAT